MKLSELLKRVPVLSAYEERDITGITEDSRKVQPGYVFVCVKGQHVDGHKLALEAQSKGAVAVVAERTTGACNEVLTENSRRAYALMCASFYDNPAEKLKLIGVTGTNGKTTTCFLIRDIFERAGIRTGLIGTVKNIIGDTELEAALTTPDPLELNALFARMVEEGLTHCVMEVSSQALEQQRVAGMHFAAALFTNLTVDHLDYHGTSENYRAAKRMLFEQTELAIVNLDDPEAAYMTDGLRCPVVSFSIKTDTSQYTAKNIRLKPSGAEYELVGNGVIGRVGFGVPGTFSVYNSMGAIVCAVELGVPFRQAVESLAHSKGVPGRLEVVPTQQEYTVIIDYAHTPDGLENVLKALKEISSGRLITVFGCGGDRDRTKRPLMGAIAAQLSDVVIVTSDNPRTEDPAEIIKDIQTGMLNTKNTVIVQENRTLAIRKALEIARKGDIVLLAGKGHETYQILNTGKIHYDEREKVADILAGKINNGT